MSYHILYYASLSAKSSLPFLADISIGSTYIYIYIYIYIHTYIHTYIYIHIYIYIYIHVMYTHIYIYIYVHTHICINNNNNSNNDNGLRKSARLGSIRTSAAPQPVSVLFLGAGGCQLGLAYAKPFQI